MATMHQSGVFYALFVLINIFLNSLIILSPEDVLPTVYLCTNKIAPDQENTVSYNLLCTL